MLDVKPRKRRLSMSASLLTRFSPTTQRAQNASHVEERHRSVLALETAGAEILDGTICVVSDRRQSVERLETVDLVDEERRLRAGVLDDERPALAYRARGLDPEERADVHERHDGAAEIDHAEQMRRG
jgi:hypothetical protein